MPRSPALIGRAAELQRLLEVTGAVTADDAGGRFVVVAGEAGIGKTRLVDELSAAAPAAVRVVRGRAGEDDAAAFGLWLPVLARLGLPRPGPDALVAANEQRWEVVDVLASALAGPALLVLEDLHWADDDGLWVLEQLLDRCSDRAVAVVATTRPGTAARTARWHALYRRAEVVALDGLDAGEVRDLAAQLGSPAADGPRLWERTGGNPLFVREQVLSGQGAVPPSIEPLLAASIEQLGPDGAALMALCALAGPATPRAVLAAAAGLAPDQLDGQIDQAQRADVLRPDQGSIRFRHDLLAAAATRALGPEERARLHLALAEAHHQEGGAASELAAARHRVLAVPLVDPTDAADTALATADRVRAGGQGADAAGLLHLACATLTGRPDVAPVVQARLAVAEAEARWALDDYDAAHVASQRAVELAARAADPYVAARAQVAATTHHNPFIPDPAATERLAELDDLLRDDDHVDPALRIRLRGRRAVLTLTMPDGLEEAVALADDAVAGARQLGDPDVVVAALSDRHLVLTSPQDYDARAAAAEEVLRIAHASRRPDLARLGHEWTYATRAYEGDLVAATAALDQLEILAAIMPSPMWRYSVALRRGCLRGLLGDYEGTLDIAASSRRLATGVVDEREALGLELALRAVAGLLYGRDDHGVEPVLARLTELTGGLPALFLQAWTAGPEAMLGDTASARRRITPWLGRFGMAFHAPEGLAALGVLAHLAVLLEWPDAASEVRGLLAPFAGRLPAGSAAFDVSVDHHLGALALVEGDLTAARAHAQAAVAFARGMRSPVLESRALALLATVTARIGDHAAAASARDAALHLAEPLGMRLPEVAEPPSAVPGRPRATRPGNPPADRRVTLQLDGGRWFIQSPFGDSHVADSAGMQQLVQLLGAPGREIAAVDLAIAARHQPVVVSGDLGAALDARAKREYRQRISELQADIDEAEDHNDGERAAKHRVELDALLDQLRAAVGIGGRDRPQGSGSERARVNAARTIRRAIAAIATELPELGAHLQVSIRTGYRCSYAPEPAAALAWVVQRS